MEERPSKVLQPAPNGSAASVAGTSGWGPLASEGSLAETREWGRGGGRRSHQQLGPLWSFCVPGQSATATSDQWGRQVGAVTTPSCGQPEAPSWIVMESRTQKDGACLSVHQRRRVWDEAPSLDIAVDPIGLTPNLSFGESTLRFPWALKGHFSSNAYC